MSYTKPKTLTQSGAYILDELNPDAPSAAETEGQWIMVMNRLRGKDEPWGLDTAYSVTELGAEEAMQRALDKMETYATRWPTLECRLQGGEW